MATYNTPGVYVEEKSLLAPSVAGVATAVPAFIGYTKTKGKKDIQPVTSLLEFESIFGGGCELTCDDKGLKGHKFVLYDSMRLFYDNGGGFCYVVSVGTYGQTPKADDFTRAITMLAQQTDVTLLVFPDAAMNFNASQLAGIQMQALRHCASVGGRFAILDVKPAGKDSTIEEDLLAFRNGVTDSLCYGAAYYPFVKTSYTKDIAFEQVLNAIPTDGLEPEDTAILEKAKGIAAAVDDLQRPLKINAIIPQIKAYAGVLAGLQETASLIPPSGAIAGIYASMDSRVGVWQAPANIGIASVRDLTRYISDGDQEKMNVDPETSKSINAIRYFRGKGILVWGARTLDGGSNEWRYIPVRRLFSYVEQSVKLATAWAVFQPNDTNTWIKIKCQISNFLSTLWRDGALAGASADQAFFVEVGKGVTMTEDDINNGYLIVRVGLAAVRPAEFIVLQFSHKVNE